MKDRQLCILTVIGTDKTGIVYEISRFFSENQINIEDITQKVMAEMFVMAMMVDISKSPLDLTGIQSGLDQISIKMGLKITIQHTDIFKSMHRI